MKRQLTMLVVDDVEVNRASLRAIFEDEYEVVDAQDGYAAIQELQNREIDIIILDLCMPGLDGAEVLKKIKADDQYKHIPVIVKTAIDENTEGSVLEAGADDFIFSPCNPLIIKNRVKNITRRYILEHELLYREMERERSLSKIRNDFTEAMFQTLCNQLDEMIVCTEKEQTKNAQGIKQQAEQMKSLLYDMTEVYAAGKNQVLQKNEVFSIRRAAAQVEERAAVAVKEEQTDCEYLLGDKEHICQLWGKLIEALSVRKERTAIQTGYAVHLEEDGQALLQIFVQTPVRNEIEETSYLIAESMTGMLQGILETSEKDGLSCCVRIPLKKGKPPVSECRDFKSMRILTVGEKEVYRDYYAAILTRLGLRFDVAEESREALELIQSACQRGEGYDVCFVSHQMGEREAASFMREVRKKIHRDTLVLVCLSSDSGAAEREMKEAGADYIMAKPVYQSTVYQLLADICAAGA